MPSTHVTYGCYFRAQKIKADGTITYEGPWFHNLVLDSGLDEIFNDNFQNLMASVGVGSGSSTPSVEQTGLDHQVAYTTNTYWRPGQDHLRDEEEQIIGKILQRTFEFGLGSAQGNLTEVGIRARSGTYFNRQLFKDSEGNPTTITVLSDEGLRIEVELRVYWDLKPGEEELGSFEHNGETINYTRVIRASQNRDNMGFGLGHSNRRIALSDNPDTRGAGVQTDSAGSIEDYVPGSFEAVFTATFSATAFVGDLHAIGVGIRYGFPGFTEFSWFFLHTPITLTDTEEFTITVKRTWGRA